MSETFAVPDSLSPSSTSTFQTCPLQFRFQNIQKLPQPPGAAAVKGNVVHRALELLFGLDAPSRTPQAAHQFLAQAKTEFEPTYDITGLNLSEAEAAKFWAECTVLVDKYLQMEDPQTINNIDVELWVTAPLQGFLLRGFIDRVERDANGGIVISERPIAVFSACFLPPKGYPCTQFSMLEAEDVGLYKFDVLSQRGLGKISEALDIIRQTHPAQADPDIHNISVLKQDPKIAQFLRNGWALGCFYVESPAMRMLLIKLQVDNYLALVAASSIIRPGVSQSGMMQQYILRHRDPEQRKAIHPLLLAIMPDTYGVMVYQEDVIKVAHYLAGLSLAEADVLRRGMSGKFRSRSEFLQVKTRFLTACAARGHEAQFAADTWRQIESFAGYAFSKGHSASYAVESYQSLYLKAHYPLAYLTACINNFGGYYRTEIYVQEARRFGAHIEAPCINEGAYHCTLKGKRLLLGFNLVLGIEAALIEKLLLERAQNGMFLSLENLLKRIYIPLEQLSLLIRIDALRSLKQARKALLWQAYFYHNKAFKGLQKPALFEVGQKQQLLPELEEHPFEITFEQFELLGFPLCDPFLLLKEALHEPFVAAKDFSKYIGKKVCSYGYLVSIKQTKTSKGDTMNFGTFLDPNGDFLDTVHFPQVVVDYPFYGKGIYLIKGKVAEEFAYLTLEVLYLEKLPFLEDVRLTQATTLAHPTPLA